ncbi:MAG: type II toxin-antitoxin system death-on-curing family toxin [Thaumarchaeota archaeon]|nr:type II toxin-antitoxin system death-on-curing family toxin [Nitrososphaerota archaeon]
METLVGKCGKIPFSTKQVGIFEQAAALFEGIVRLHIFTDGNKRTALETTRQFLNRNSYVLIVPLSGVNFIYKIAQDCKPDTEKVLREITEWLTNHSAETNQWHRIVGLLVIHIYWPVFWARFFSKIRLRRCGRWVIKKYLMNEDPQVTEFMIEIYEKQFNLFELARKQYQK